jgi:glycosyltransferase involved in cell wall biosynthesis
VIQPVIEQPLVSLVITTYNRAEMLKDALEGAIIQTYRNLEIIVVDNASTDYTSEVVEDFIKKDSRVRYIKRVENLGAIKNSHLAFIEDAKGDWFIFVSDDDAITDPNFVEEGMKVILEQDDTVAFYQTGVKVLHEINNTFHQAVPKMEHNIQIFEKGQYFLNYFDISFFSFTTTIFNRKEIINLNIFENHFVTDVELLLVLSLNGKVILLKKISGFYRVHATQNFGFSSFYKYLSLFNCYYNSAKYVIKHDCLSRPVILNWLQQAKKYFYLNIIGWEYNMANGNTEIYDLPIKINIVNRILDKMNFVGNTPSLWISKIFSRTDNKSYYYLYPRGVWHCLIWYFYASIKIKSLYLNSKTFKNDN